MLDLYEDLASTLPAWLIVMFGSVFILLLLMTGSVVIPIKAVLYSVLSLGALVGLIVMLFGEHGLTAALNFQTSGYFDGTNIIFICAIAFSLSVDYEIFLISQIQEIYHEIGDTREAVARGLQRSGQLITSAALMFALVTAAFLGSDLYFIKVIGLGIAMAVILDATLSRMILVPATLSLLGEWCWYCPGPLRSVIEFIGIQEVKGVRMDRDQRVTHLQAEVVSKSPSVSDPAHFAL